MKRAVFICAAAALLLCAAVAQARVLVAEAEAETGRSLLQRTLDCKRVHRACSTCRNQRVKGTKKTETICSTCNAGWRLRKDGASKTCDCAPGYYMNGTQAQAAATCLTCTKGSYCLGGDASNGNSQAATCPTGLETKFTGAKSVAQCFTQPGHGRKSSRNPSTGVVTYTGVVCPVGTFNVGGNTMGCQRCGAGLTTNDTGKSNGVTDCLAPAGSYYDKGTGKKCPKGTYTTGLNQASVCTPCNEGVTTASEGSTAESACDRAIPGYKYTALNTAAKCDLHTYNDAETTSSTCTACPFAMLTREEGAKGASDCLAPPGWAQASAGANITECLVNTFKEGWNRNPCVACGTNVVTEGTGSVSKDACLVPPGHGLTQLSPTLIAAPCTTNSYGDDEFRTAVASARCTACPPNMYTSDKWGTTAPASGYTNQTECKVDRGWGTTETSVEICQVGFYNVGQNRAPCTACPNGYTTLGTNSTAATDCVIKAGWYYDSVKAIPSPCDKGTYSTGGTATTREPTSCTSCSTGYSTQEQESDAATDCAVCDAGYGSATSGGATCERCPINTFSSGGLAVGETCVACATGSVSSKGATESSQCYAEMADPTRDYFTLSNDALFVAGGVGSACSAACVGDATCIQVKIPTDASATCYTWSEDAAGSGMVSFKVNGGVDFVRYKTPTGLSVGSVIATNSAATIADCEATCKPLGDCEGVVLDGNCKLFTSELDPEYSGFYHVYGTKLASYVA